MAPRDLVAPLLGQREETIALLSTLTESDLDRIDGGTGWSVREILGHIASAQLGSAFFIRMAAAGEVIHMDVGDRDGFNIGETAKTAGWSLARCRAELEDAAATLAEVFDGIAEEQLDNPIRWPEWPARTIRSSIPYMLEHEASHMSQIQRLVNPD